MKNIVDKLLSRGSQSLSDAELLALVVGDAALGEALMKDCGGSLARLAGQDVARLRMMEGLGLRRAVRVAAVIELGRRAAAESAGQKSDISTSDDVDALFRPLLVGLQHEECWVVYIQLLDHLIIARGGNFSFRREGLIHF